MPILSIFIILFFTILMLKITIPYFKNDFENGFILSKQAIQHLTIWRLAFYIHISTSILPLFFGVFQFIANFRITYPKLHRIFGYFYIGTILFFSAPSGLVMAIYANGGIVAKISFCILSLLWWIFSFISLKNAKNLKFSQHQQYAIRSYALTLSAISLRILVLVLPHFFILHASQMYSLIAWLSWIPNLIIAELIIFSIKSHQ